MALFLVRSLYELSNHAYDIKLMVSQSLIGA